MPDQLPDDDGLKTLRDQYRGRPRRQRTRREPPRRVRVMYVRDLADAFKCSTRTIWRRVKKKELPEPFSFLGQAAWREENITRLLDKGQPIQR